MRVARVAQWISNSGIKLAKRPYGAVVAGGSLIGFLAVSTWLPWTLTVGDDGVFAAAASLALALGVSAGSRLRRGIHFDWVVLALIACAWTLLQLLVLRGLTEALALIPVNVFASIPARGLIAFACAIPTWFVMGVVVTSFAADLIEQSVSRGLSFSFSAAGMSLGAVCGLGLSTFVVAPLLGAWFVPLAAFTLIGLGRLSMHRRGFGASDIASIASTGDSYHAEQNGGFGVGAKVAAAIAIGGLLASVMRLVGQLMPNGCQVLAAEWIGLLVGFSAGLSFRWSRRNSTSLAGWMVIFAAASSAMLLAAMPFLVNVSLNMTATLTWVVLLMTFRTLLLAASVAPLGMAIAGLISTSGNHLAVGSRPGSQRTSRSDFSTWLPVALVIGFFVAQSCFSSMGLIVPLTACCLGLVSIGTIQFLRAGLPALTWRSGGVMASLFLMGVSVPLWSAHDDASRVAKLLFSTPSFVAHRSGWDSRLLPVLDDARMIAQVEGPRGHLTLWRSHGAELHLRENGIPRGVISANPEIYPQFAPEVLQAVFPLVMAERPERVLILGMSGGVPLATCLRFPIQHVVCAEGNSALIAMQRRALARETGYDPLADDRVRLLDVPPELALMGNDEPYDVILSSPASSSIVAGAAVFTTEHFRRASRRLADRGVFCQRFECIDYGPEPLRLVVQSMRQAFREVIAIETAAGEFLLLATNSEDVFVPEDVTARLEAPHVRRLLARCGLDWSTPLNFPAYDHAALGEICSEVRERANTSGNGLLALRAPWELMRWGPKLQEVQQVLTATRTTEAPFWNTDDKPNLLAGEAHLTRKSRILEWLGDRRVSPEVLRRLSEVATQQKLVRENPESHWWEYRRALRMQLQERPYSKIQQVAHSSDERSLHPDDQRRKDYFVALGAAAQRPKPTQEQFAAIQSCLEPYDPLVSYFARQEIADLQARSKLDPSAEFAYRMHVIYFAPAIDASTRNVAAAIELLVQSPEAIPDPARRFDVLNGLVQTLRSRWETRQSYPVKSTRRQTADVDRSVVAIEKGVAAMQELYSSAGMSQTDWGLRQQVIDRLLLRPLRTYRTELQASAARSESRTREIVESAAQGDETQ